MAREHDRRSALENPHVEVVYGMHMMPDVPIGRFPPARADDGADVRNGYRHSRLASHGAMPHLGATR
ncbi:MAG: hypothetical protein ACLUMK_06870 [Christensenellales bacterium]